MTSTLVFDITQFFPFLNHQLLLLILKKTRCHFKVVQFFSNYLVGRKMQYSWNNFSSQFFNVDIGVEQGLAFFPILSAIYIVPIFHILENQLKNLKIPVSILSFVDNGLFIAQSKSLTISNSILFCSHNIISSILDKFGLALEHGKMEVFYFSRAQSIFNPLLLNITDIGSPILKPKNIWKYLSFIFNMKLLFHQHINFYINKVIVMIQYSRY